MENYKVNKYTKVTIKKEVYELAKTMASEDSRSVANLVEYLILKEARK